MWVQARHILQERKGCENLCALSADDVVKALRHEPCTLCFLLYEFHDPPKKTKTIEDYYQPVPKASCICA